MKKFTTPKKLNLRLESLKQLRSPELQQIIGGATSPCNHPTTTVISTDC
jgi:hypothetical protein